MGVVQPDFPPVYRQAGIFVSVDCFQIVEEGESLFEIGKVNKPHLPHGLLGALGFKALEPLGGLCTLDVRVEGLSVRGGSDLVKPILSQGKERNF